MLLCHGLGKATPDYFLLCSITMRVQLTTWRRDPEDDEVEERITGTEISSKDRAGGLDIHTRPLRFTLT